MKHGGETSLVKINVVCCQQWLLYFLFDWSLEKWKNEKKNLSPSLSNHRAPFSLLSELVTWLNITASDVHMWRKWFHCSDAPPYGYFWHCSHVWDSSPSWAVAITSFYQHVSGLLHSRGPRSVTGGNHLPLWSSRTVTWIKQWQHTTYWEVRKWCMRETLTFYWMTWWVEAFPLS